MALRSIADQGGAVERAQAPRLAMAGLRRVWTRRKVAASQSPGQSPGQSQGPAQPAGRTSGAGQAGTGQGGAGQPSDRGQGPPGSQAKPWSGRLGTSQSSIVIDNASLREYLAELIGTAILVFFGAGISTVVFGFRAFGSSVAAGILLTGLTFGLVLIGLYALIGHISGCHVNPAVTLGAYLCRRISLRDAVGYWVAQLIGGILGALLLLWVFHSSPFYTRSRNGLGANGWGAQSLLHVSAGGAFLAEVIFTAVFVLIVLSATRRGAPAAVTGLIMGFGLALVITLGAPIDGGSANPARSLGPAVVVGGTAINQVWLFIVAPLIGAIIGAAAYLGLHPEARPSRLMGPGGEAGERPASVGAGGQDQTGSGGMAPQPGQVGTRPGSATGSGTTPGASAARPGQPGWRGNPPQDQPPSSPGNPRR